MVGYRVGGASSIWMSSVKYTILTATQKLLTTFTVSNYPHQSLLCEEPTPPSDVGRPNWRPFNQTQHPQSPIHDEWCKWSFTQYNIRALIAIWVLKKSEFHIKILDWKLI